MAKYSHRAFKPKYSRRASKYKYSRKAFKPKYSRRAFKSKAFKPKAFKPKYSRNKRHRKKYSVRRITPRNFNPPIVVSTPPASSVVSSISAPWSDNIPMNVSSPEILNSGLTDVESNEDGVIFDDENISSLHLSDLNVDNSLHLSALRTPSNKTTVESDL